jgi:PEP-CTERM motif
MLGIIAFGLSVPQRAFADRIDLRVVDQVFGPSQYTSDLRIRGVSNFPLPVVGLENPNQSIDRASRARTQANIDSQSLLSGVGFYAFAQDPQKLPQGTVDVAICDCGEETVPVPGGFPKWPLVFLAGIPLFFIDGDEDTPPPTFTPTPVPPQVPVPSVPEPASLLLLLTGIGAVGLRLRKSRVANREHE